MKSRRPPLNILVWGEIGDGKSTLINTLVGKKVCEAGKKPSGVTKNVDCVTAYINETLAVRLWDTPGAGDKDVPAYKTLELLGCQFSQVPVDGLLLLSSRADRMPLGAQLVAKLMDLSFSSADKWASVVLVGTKNDKYDEDDEKNFFGPVLQEFNRTVEGNITKVCTCNQNDMSAVIAMIEQLVDEKGVGDYKQPSPATIAGVVCDLNGVEHGEERNKQMEAMIDEIKTDRAVIAAELKEARNEAWQQQLRHEEKLSEVQQDLNRARQEARDADAFYKMELRHLDAENQKTMDGMRQQMMEQERALLERFQRPSEKHVQKETDQMQEKLSQMQRQIDMQNEQLKEERRQKQAEMDSKMKQMQDRVAAAERQKGTHIVAGIHVGFFPPTIGWYPSR